MPAKQIEDARTAMRVLLFLDIVKPRLKGEFLGISSLPIVWLIAPPSH